MIEYSILPSTLHRLPRRPPAQKKTCFLKNHLQKHLVKLILLTQTSSQTMTFGMKWQTFSVKINDFAVALGSTVSPGWKKPCFLKNDYQKHLVKLPLETQTSSQITTFEWKVKKNMRLFQRFCEHQSFYNENCEFPMFASRWLPDAASGRLAKPKAKTKTRTKTKAETKIEAKSKTRLRLSLRPGLRQRLRLKLRIVSNWTHV